MSSSSYHIELTLCATPSPFPHSRFSSVPLNLYCSTSLRIIDFQTRQTLSSSSQDPWLHGPFQLHPQLLNSPALLSHTLYRFLSDDTHPLGRQWRASLAEEIGRFISEQQPPLSQVDAHIQIVRSQSTFRFVDGVHVIDAVDVERENRSATVKEFVNKQSYDCGDEREEEECSICYENYRKVRKAVKTQCDHVFHRHCISKWLLNNNSCPLCRKRVY